MENVGKKNAKTLAMRLGTEMHKLALACAGERLSKLRPGGFSVEPCYLYDPTTKKWAPIDRDTEEALRQCDRSRLKGSLVPDIVIHSGNIQRVFMVYDFKFPCVDIDEKASWRHYTSNSPHHGRNQDELYKEATGMQGDPVIIQPRIGVFR